jgi:16S rRNA (cytosine967-C5)-methyltransferase
MPAQTTKHKSFQKLYRPLAQQVATALIEIFLNRRYADRVLERLFRDNKKLGARDRRFIAESVYEIVRWWRLIWAAIGSEPPKEFRDADAWRVLGAWLIIEGQDLPEWEEFKRLDRARILAQHQAALKTPSLCASVPDWLYDLGRAEIGERWDRYLEELNKQAPVVLRANRLKTTREELKRSLAEEGIETAFAPATEDGLVLTERRNIFTAKAFQLGLFEVQDGASQQIAPFLALQPGLRVIDACAGAGGKTLHIAALLKNKGKIIAMDVGEKKLDELRRRASRAGADVIETKLIDSTKVVKRLEKSADRVLLDVPCSGLGVLRRNPDAKWQLSMAEVSRLRELQAEILRDYSVMVKPGGRLVYATCSCLPSENEKQVERFLEEQNRLGKPRWDFVAERKFAPGENGYDGFYAAAIERCPE